MAPSSITRSPVVAKMHRLQKKLEDTPESDRPAGSEMLCTMAMVMDEQHQEGARHRKNVENQMGEIRESIRDSHVEISQDISKSHAVIMERLNKKGLIATVKDGCIKHWPYVLVGVVLSGGGLAELFSLTSFLK